MKPIHWTLLAICLASCRALNGAKAPALGPGSRVVIPDLAQPRTNEPAVEIVPAPTAESAPMPAPRAQIHSAWELIAVAIADALTRTSERVEVVPPATKREPDPVVPAAGGTNVAAAANDPASYLKNKPALLAELEKATAEGRFRDVSEIAAELASLDPLEQARLRCSEGKLDEAMAVLVQALVDTPNRPELQEALGNVQLRLADAGKRELFPAALDNFQRAGSTPTALLGASRAAYALEQFDQALDCAQRAIVLLTSQQALRLELSPAPEVVLADAGLEVQRRLRAKLDPAATALFNELEAALIWRIDRVGTDAAAHAHLAGLYLDVGRVDKAESAAERGLVSSPGDPELARILARAAFSLGKSSLGKSEELLAAFTRFRDSNKFQPLGYWYPAFEFFSNSVEHFTLPMFKGSGKEQLERAEYYFSLVRDLDSRYTDSCRQYEALCWALKGWELFNVKRMPEALQNFKTMDRVLPGSLALDAASVEARWAGRIGSGASGLEKIAAYYRDDKKDLARAAAVQADLADLLPSDAHWAREAALSAKQAADSLADEAKNFGDASRGAVLDPTRLNELRDRALVRESIRGTPKELKSFASLALARKQQSDQLFLESWERYKTAVRLTPQDVRLACDAAHVAIYHVPHELALAEQLLSSAVHLAEEQELNSKLTDNEMEQLKNAHGSALADQGLIALDMQGNPKAAVVLFQQALRVDRLPRPAVSEELLPRAIEACKKLEDAAGTTATTENPSPKKQP